MALRVRMMDPWREMLQLRREMDRLFESALGRKERRLPACNLWEGEDDYLVTCELPGVSMDNLDISVMGDQLTVSGERNADPGVEDSAYHRRERGSGRFSRTIPLPGRADANSVEAHLSNGVLQVTLPKSEEEKPRKIEIKTA